jgi:hypothetical protein
VIVPPLLKTDVGNAEPVSTHEHADDTFIGLLPQPDTKVGNLIVAVFWVAVYEAQNCSPTKEARYSCRKQLSRLQFVGSETTVVV